MIALITNDNNAVVNNGRKWKLKLIQKDEVQCFVTLTPFAVIYLAFDFGSVKNFQFEWKYCYFTYTIRNAEEICLAINFLNFVFECYTFFECDKFKS